MSPLIPQHILQVKPYKPGKPLEEIRREYHLDSIAKLASNENTTGPSPKVLEAMRQSLAEIHWYPDPNALQLREALSHKMGRGCDWIHLGNGTEEILSHIVKAFLPPSAHAVRAEMTFPIYGILAGLAQVEETVVPMQDLKHDLRAMAEAVREDTRVVWLCNPNNPTGTWFSENELLDFFQHLKYSPLVVLDEAYFEYGMHNPDYANGLEALEHYPNLVVSRTFSKAYGLSGARVGYSIQRPELTDVLNRVRLPFHINHPAQMGALAALEDEEWLQVHLQTVAQEKSRIRHELNSMGAQVWPSLTNFLFFTGMQDAHECYESLLREGVAVRPLPYSSGGAIRVTMGTTAENDRFLQAIRKCPNFRDS